MVAVAGMLEHETRHVGVPRWNAGGARPGFGMGAACAGAYDDREGGTLRIVLRSKPISQCERSGQSTDSRERGNQRARPGNAEDGLL